MYDLMIIGGGPAAISAACYALEKRIDFAMIYESLGGQAGPIAQWWEPQKVYALPRDEVMFTLARHISTTAEHLIQDRVLTVARHKRSFVVETREHGYVEAMVLLVATGATPRSIPLPDASRLLDPRLQYSISSYAHLAAGKRVAVIGDTARALHGVAELARIAERVYLIVADGSRMSTPFAQTLCRLPNVELLAGYSVTGVAGGATIERLQLDYYGTTHMLDVAHAFVSLGLQPNSAIVAHLVDTDRGEFILVNEHHETTMPGIFAAGDVATSRSEQVMVSLGDGERAAARAYDHLLAQRLVFGSRWKMVREKVST